MLAQIQDKILRSVLSGNVEMPNFIKQTNNINPVERLLIHRLTILENFLQSLKISYPGIWGLLGAKCAREIGLDYIHNLENIPSASKMHEFGVNFAEHLKIFSFTKRLPYLPDFAKLEWLRSLSFDAPNETAFKIEDLYKMNINDLAQYKFIFNSSIFFLKSSFNLAEVQNLIDTSIESLLPNQIQNDIIRIYNVDCSYICVYRNNGEVNTAWLDKATWYFLWLLSKGKTLDTALDEIEKMELKLDLESSFKFMFQRNIVKSGIKI